MLADSVMKCLWQDIPDSTDARGWRRVECVRCGLKLHPTPHEHAKIHAECYGIPFWHEIGNWLELALAVIWLDKRRWLWLKGKLGAQPKCGCQQRQESANQLGQMLCLGLCRLVALQGRIYSLTGKLWQKLLPVHLNGARGSDAQPDSTPRADPQDLDRNSTV